MAVMSPFVFDVETAQSDAHLQQTLKTSAMVLQEQPQQPPEQARHGRCKRTLRVTEGWDAANTPATLSK